MNPSKFKICTIIQVPRLSNYQLWWIYKGQTERFLITAANRENYQIVDNIDFCKPMNDDVTICDRPRIWTSASARYCVWDLFNHNSESKCQAIQEPARTIIDLAEDNKFIFVCDVKQQLTVLCDKTVLHLEIEGESIIKINEKCKIKTINQEILTTLNIDDEFKEIIVHKFPHIAMP